MKRAYKLCALAAVPLFVLRLCDVLKHVDFSTGYYDSSVSVFLLVVQAVLFASSVAFTAIKINKTEKGELSGAPAGSSRLFVVFGALAVLVLIASVAQMISSATGKTFSMFFASRTKLREMGIINPYFKVEFLCGAAGIAAAVWFAWSAARYLKHGGSLAARPLFGALPVVWYCLRAISEFSKAPVNANDTVTVCTLASLMLLGAAWLAFIRRAAISPDSANTRKALKWAYAAFLFTISFAAPGIVPISSQGMYRSLLAMTDVVSALCLLWAAGDFLSKETAHEQ